MRCRAPVGNGVNAPRGGQAGFVRRSRIPAGRATVGQVSAHSDPASDLTPLEEREQRLANNEVVFRSVNEEIEQLALSLGGDGYEFICECSKRGCFERVLLSRCEYEHVRAEGVRFFVVPGHENPEVELVVEAKQGYLVVEKDGHAGTVAEAADPRDGDLET